MTRPVIATLLASLIVLGCQGIGDPGYSVAFRNESDAAILVRRAPSDPGGPGSWLIASHSAGLVLSTLGAPREEPPIDYEILDATSCATIATAHVDLTTAPNPGYSEFVVVLDANRGVHVETRTSSDQAIAVIEGQNIVCPDAVHAPHSLFIENDAGISVVVAIDGVTLDTAKPGFRGALLTTLVLDRPHAISLGTEGGTFLALWRVPTDGAAFGWFPDPACGQVQLWLDDPEVSFEPQGPVAAATCPR